MPSKLTRDYNLKQDRKDTANLPVHGVVSRPLPEEDSVVVESALVVGKNSCRIGHPYMGVNSWIRVMPEAGTEILTMERGDANTKSILSYLANSMIKRLKEGRKGKQLIRVLNPGEIELMSSGKAYMFLGDGGDIELRGGTIRMDLLQTEQEHTSLAPTYLRRLHLHTPDKLAYCERFGVVKRPDKKLPSAFQQYVRRPQSAASAASSAATSASDAASTLASGDSLTVAPTSIPQDFAFEYSRWLSDSAGSTLVSLQEGHCYDETGTEKKQTSTNKPLRLERLLSDKNGMEDFTFQVDEELNVFYDNANAVSKEAKLQFGNLVTLDISADQYKLTVNKTGAIRYGTSLTLTSPKVNVKSADVNFGDNPIYSAIIGTTFVNSVMTPLVAALQSFFTVYGADAAISTFSPQTVASAAAAMGVMASTLSQLSSTLSQQVKLSG